MKRKYLWFEITVHNSVVTHKDKRHEHLRGEPSDQRGCESNKCICFDQFIKIDTHQLHCYAQVIAEIKMIIHFNDVMFLIRILKRVSQQGSQ